MGKIKYSNYYKQNIFLIEEITGYADKKCPLIYMNNKYRTKPHCEYLSEMFDF